MTEENKPHTCLVCGAWKRYYCKGVRQFDKTPYGFCEKKKVVVRDEESCKEWTRDLRIRKTQRKSAERALGEILSDLSAIRQILEEQGEENADQAPPRD